MNGVLKIRTDAGLTQAELAARSGVAQPNIAAAASKSWSDGDLGLRPGGREPTEVTRLYGQRTSNALTEIHSMICHLVNQ